MQRCANQDIRMHTTPPRSARLRGLLLYLAIVAILIPPSLTAQTEESPVVAEISVSKAQIYERETFFLTLTIKTSGVQIRKKLDLNGLPDKQRVDIFTPFESLPTQRTGDAHRMTEIHRYRCRARALTTGTIRIAPNLKLVAMRRRRMLIGSAWEEVPIKVDIAPLHLAVKQLPPPPSDFSGAIGSFSFDATIAPTNIVRGDLITLTSRLFGDGYTEGIRKPEIARTDLFKTYDSKLVHTAAGRLVYEQIVIPQSTTIQTIPEVSLTYFEPATGRYKRIVRGPFPIAFHSATTTTLEHFRPSDADAASPAATNPPATPSLRSRLQTMLGHARYEQATCQTTIMAHMAPSTSSYSHFKLEPGEELSVLRQHKAWILIEANNKRGWILRASLSETATPLPPES
jgi:hypothetical protein